MSVGRASAWIATIIIGRELLIMGLRGLVAADGVVMKPSIWGKLKTNAQFVAILLAIVHPHVSIGPLRLDEVAMLAAAADHRRLGGRVPGAVLGLADRRGVGHRDVTGVLVTGATGFVGGGDRPPAARRRPRPCACSPARPDAAAALLALGAEVVAGDMLDARLGRAGRPRMRGRLPRRRA